MKKKVLVFLFVAMLMIFAFATACAGDAPAPVAPDAPADVAAPAATPAPDAADDDPAPAVTGGDGLGYRFAIHSDTPTMNAHNSMWIVTGDIHAFVHSGLFRRVPTPDRMSSHIIPDIASELPFTVDEEGLVWHIPLRPYARFHNGTPITAHTFEQSYQFLLDPLLVNAMANFLIQGNIRILNAMSYFTQDPPTTWEEVGIRAVDDHTLEIITEAPFHQHQVMTHFLDRSTMPVYIEFYESGMNESRTETTYGSTHDQFMGAGPFFFDDWIPDGAHVFSRNPDHWLAEHFNFDRVQITIVPDAGARMQLFLAGEIDIHGLGLADFVQFQDDPRLRVSTGVMPTHIEINNLNEDNPILQTLDFRRALQWGVDRATISTLTHLPGQAVYIGPEAGAFLGDGTFFRDTPQGQRHVPPNYGFDPERSRAYFDSAIAEAGVDFVTIRFLYGEASDQFRVIGEFLQQTLPELWGADRFEFVLQAAPTATIGAQRNWRETTDWDLSIEGWGTIQQRDFPHQAFHHMIPYASRPNPFMPDTFLEAWHRGQALASEIPMNVEALLEIAAELEYLWMYYVINVPVLQNKGFTLVSERIETGMDRFMPGIGWGFMFGREAEQ